MRRRRASLLALGLLVCPVFASSMTRLPAPSQGSQGTMGRPSVIVAEWVRDRFLGFLDCGAETICMQFFVDARIRRVRTLTGPRIPGAVTVRAITLHHPHRGERVVMIIQPGRPPEAWRGIVIIQNMIDQVCVPVDQMRGFNLTPPRESRIIENEVCLAIGR
jgi:hypothetical protein